MLGRFALGVMQGRLLPKYEGRYQAHPRGYWQDEFALAAERGLDLIEFILDYGGAAENPLASAAGRASIAGAVADSGVAVRSVCADYFMEAPLHAPDSAAASDSLAMLKTLVRGAPELGLRDIVIPCVDHSRLATAEDQDRLVRSLEAVLPIAEDMQVNLALETDLDPAAFAALLGRLPSPRIAVNYDSGNSAAHGYDPRAEFAAYGPRITDLHIKDRTRGGGPVALGEGDADFDALFSLLADGFSGYFIMQAYRDDEGLAVFDRQHHWLQERYASSLT